MGLGQTIDTTLFKRIEAAAQDPDLYVDIARLCTADDPSKALNMYLRSLEIRLSQNQPGVPPQLLNNIGCLEYLKKDHQAAKAHFQQALIHTAQASDMDGQEQDAALMTATYNLAVVMEALGEQGQAIQLYRQRILERHPEFMEGVYQY